MTNNAVKSVDQVIRTSHLLNSTSVRETLLGLVQSKPYLMLLESSNVVINRESISNRKRFVVISGGGSGHEPFAAGMVGPGGIDGAVAGNIFASPSANSALDAIYSFPKETGVLMLFENYTGDRLNFGLALERARCDGYDVEILTMQDDCAFFEDETNNNCKVGRRGLAGIYFAYRIVASVFSQNNNAPQSVKLKDILPRVIDSLSLISTHSVSLNCCHIPDVGQSFELPKHQFELGLGIHGEAGTKRIDKCSLSKVVSLLLAQLFRAIPIKLSQSTEWKNQKDKPTQIKLAVLINNLGGTSQFELNAAANETLQQIRKNHASIAVDGQLIKTKVARFLHGTFVTSISMHGISITILPILDDNVLSWIDKSEQEAVKNLISYEPQNDYLLKSNLKAIQDQEQNREYMDELKEFKNEFLNALQRACQSMVDNEVEINQLDSELGDSDCGSTMAEMGQLLMQKLDAKLVKPSFLHLSEIISGQIGGTSGAIYSLFFAGAASKITEIKQQNKQGTISYYDGHFWSDVINAGIKAVSKYSFAEPGDRTLLDAIAKMPQLLRNKLNPVDTAAKRIALVDLVKASAKETANMIPRAGRATYVKSKQLKQIDPGAMAAFYIVQAILGVKASF